MIIAISGLLLLVLGQVVRLQTSGGENLRAEGEDQWSRYRDMPAQRGTIFDRDGQEMAISVPSATISVDPQNIEDVDEVIALLVEIVDIDEEMQAKIRDEVQRADRRFMYVARQIPVEVGERLYKVVETRGLAGVMIDWEDKRLLPGGVTGRSVIGLTDIDGVGISGIELKYGGGEAGEEVGYEDVLSGTAGRSARAISPDGSTVIGSERITTEPVPGRDLMLTIDRSVQFAVEELLLERVEEIDTKGGQVIVMNTKTGETLAMASVLRNPDTGEPEVTARNSAAVDAYEPGSVVKAITVAAALNERTVTPETSFLVPWRKQYADDWLSDAAPHPDEEMTVRDILVHSSNIGTIMIKEGMANVPEVARRVHWNYMRQFGLGERTGIEFPGESVGIVKDWDELWGSERATVSYGQGVSSTSIQLIAAINTIANDGTYVVPSLVKGVIDEEGHLEPAEPAATHEVIRPEVALQMHDIMRSVVCDGTAELAQSGISNYAIAGKTGTGYKAQPDGQYKDADGNFTYYASFVGFFPLDDPQITMLVSMDEPPAGSLNRFGGTAAAPLFADLVPVVANAAQISPETGSGVCLSDDDVVSQEEGADASAASDSAVDNAAAPDQRARRWAADRAVDDGSPIDVGR